jgi:hypothetical protein
MSEFEFEATVECSVFRRLVGLGVSRRRGLMHCREQRDLGGRGRGAARAGTGA